MLDGVYHRDVYFPQEIRSLIPKTLDNLSWSKHAQEKAYAEGILLYDNYDNLLPIEVEIEQNGIWKVVYRHSLFSWADICFPVVRTKRFRNLCFATTVWLTEIYDWHKTLDESKYVRQ